MDNLPIVGLPSPPGTTRISKSLDRQQQKRERRFEQSLTGSNQDQTGETDDTSADAKPESPSRTLQEAIEQGRRNSQDGEHLIDVMV